jgi:hypothetical protein
MALFTGSKVNDPCFLARRREQRQLERSLGDSSGIYQMESIRGEVFAFGKALGAKHLDLRGIRMLEARIHGATVDL